MNLPFGKRLMNLMNIYDNEINLSHDDRIEMYVQIFEEVTFIPLLFEDMIESLKTYYNELRKNNNYNAINKLESKLKNKLFIHTSKDIYQNIDNVHNFTSNTVKIAKKIMKKYPSKYIKRPFDHYFFDMIEKEDNYNDINIPDLFSSVYYYILNHKYKDEMLKRFNEEIDDANNMCISGCVNRLINSIRGFNDRNEFNLTLEMYEYEKAKVFNEINKYLDVFSLDNFFERLESLVNKGTIYLPSSKKMTIEILNNYSKRNWIYKDNKYKII